MGRSEKEEKAPPPAVAMRGGGRARSFRPWSFGTEREEFENVQEGLGNRFDKEVVARVSLTRLSESHIISLTQSKKKQIHAQITSPVHRICDLSPLAAKLPKVHKVPSSHKNVELVPNFIKIKIFSLKLIKFLNDIIFTFY